MNSVMMLPAWIRFAFVDALEARQADRQRLDVVVAGEVDQRPEEVVPRVDERKIETATTTGQAWGRITEREHPERAGPVDRGRLVQVARDRQQVLAHQEHVVGVGEEGRDQQRQPRPHPAELHEQRVGRDEGHGAGRKIVAISSVNSRPRPGNLNRANPYATRVHESTVPIVPMTAIATVLNSRRGKSMRSQTLA